MWTTLSKNSKKNLFNFKILFKRYFFGEMIKTSLLIMQINIYYFILFLHVLKFYGLWQQTNMICECFHFLSLSVASLHIKLLQNGGTLRLKIIDGILMLSFWKFIAFIFGISSGKAKIFFQFLAIKNSLFVTPKQLIKMR